MANKLTFYDTHGITEHYLYDPDHDRLRGWLRDGRLAPIALMHGSSRRGIMTKPMLPGCTALRSATNARR